jgi:tRNA threonylcarbamoyladenosine biosynthesis protein TsaB
MSLILSLETSTSVCSAALHERGKLLASYEIHIEQTQASKLAVLVSDLIRNSGFQMQALKAIAVTSGPGSYTGLRIGTSTAKGLCFALNIPLITIDTLTLLASQLTTVNIHEALLCPMIDARRMEVYCLLCDNQVNTIAPIEAKVIDENSFSEYLRNYQILFFGSGAEKCKNVIQHINAYFIPNIFPAASELGKLAYENFEKNDFVDLVSYEPFYLKEFQVKKSGQN